MLFRSIHTACSPVRGQTIPKKCDSHVVTNWAQCYEDEGGAVREETGAEGATFIRRAG